MFDAACLALRTLVVGDSTDLHSKRSSRAGTSSDTRHKRSLDKMLGDLAASESDGGDIKRVLENISEQGCTRVLSALAVKETSVSKLSYTIVDAIIKLLEMNIIDGEPLQLNEITTNVNFSPFNWPHNDEERDSPQACKDLELELAKFGVIFGRNGYKLVDVHFKQRIPKGGADALIIPYKTAAHGCALQLRVVFEFKLPENMVFEKYRGDYILMFRNKFPTEKNIVGEFYGELLCSLATSHQPCLMVLTDLRTQCFIGRCINGDIHIWACDNMNEGMNLISNFVVRHCNPSERYKCDFNADYVNIDPDLVGLKIIKKYTSDDGHPLLEQLELINDIENPGERFGEALSIIQSWNMVNKENTTNT
ncbi:unnamed protein product [Didymodactylos carnosus]|uniref:Uncharacterized protein n=1 Tax=Didymodactylos carnosus TaxID=1234261 RepID=A0A813YZ77_9BILA|nr:unnamed protein product [Didymodactylos carnosus]CAF3675124.1 unnamed protein product [Didymodactylos carnosus]